jgi:hypothetical protein
MVDGELVVGRVELDPDRHIRQHDVAGNGSFEITGPD